MRVYARAHSNQVDYQEAFNSKVARLLDLTQPDLGYVPPTMHAMAPATMQATARTTARTTVPAVRGASPARERHASQPHVRATNGPSDLV